MDRKQKKKKDGTNWFPILMVLAGVAVIILRPGKFADHSASGHVITSWPKIRYEATVEAGDPLPDVSDFVDGAELTDVKIVSGLDETTDMNTIADYDLTLNVLGRNIPAVLHVVDTTPPAVVTKDVQIYDFEGLDAMDFIASIDDATAADVSFSIDPDEEKSGRHTVHITVRDEGGNVTEQSAGLVILADRQGPEIAGVQDISILVGGKVSYLETINVTDDYDPDPTLKVDNSAVNTEEPGDYDIIYTATDAAGNVTQKTAVLHVRKPQPGEIILTEEMIYAEADKILAKITTPGMSQYDTAKAIYDWAHGNIAYIHMENKTDWLKAAWDGMVNKKGDCYVYAQASRALLTRAGITNKIINKIPAATVHYWNLIDIGEGWRHFDATRRRDGSTHFYETQEEIVNYSNTHNLSHNYDKELFPDIP